MKPGIYFERLLLTYFKDARRSSYLLKYLLTSFRNKSIYGFFVLNEKRLVYITVPKAGSTSIRYQLGGTHGVKASQDKDFYKLDHLDPSWSKYYKFTFVRNPYSRLVSCYRDKVLALNKVDSLQNASSYFSGAPFYISPSSSFADFVKIVSMIPDEIANIHFRSQYSLTHRKGQRLFDWVGKIEEIQFTWPKLATEFGLAPKILSENHTAKGQDYRQLYTKELVELVYERYSDDFEIFGYSSDL